MSRAFAPGDRIPLELLAIRLRVSTMPVREALVALSNEGLAEVLPRRGFRVAAIPPSDIQDVFTVHARVATLLAGRAALNADDDLIRSLQSLQQRIVQFERRRMPSTERWSGIEQLNYEFHRAINRRVNAKRLHWFLRAATRYIPRRFYETNWLPPSLRCPRDLVAGLPFMKPTGPTSWGHLTQVDSPSR